MEGLRLLCVLVTFVAVWKPILTTLEPFQSERLFDLACGGCMVSNGLGYNPFQGDCTCFYICSLLDRAPNKLSSQEWLSYKRCCPCGTSWSQKRLTCVQWRSKLSSCFGPVGSANANNPCFGTTGNAVLPRQSPDAVEGPFEFMCSGYLECQSSGSAFAPFPVSKCCPNGQCFDDTNEACSTSYCASGVCALLDDTDDCECTSVTEGPVALDCHFTAHETDINKFIGKESMIPYDCAPGTCWDQELCTCALTNQTGYALGCRKYLDVVFTSGGVDATDGGGFSIYSTYEDVNFTTGEAVFDGSTYTYAYIDGTARTWLGNTWIAKLNFSLTTNAGNTGNENQCLVGNCLALGPGSTQQSIQAFVDREADGTGDGILIDLQYQDKPLFMTGTSVNEEEVVLDITYELAVDTDYELWIVFCGDEDRAGAAIYDATGTIVAETEVENLSDQSYNLIMRDSGFAFGKCRSASTFEGTMSTVEMWTCKPDGNAEIEDLIEEVFDTET